MFTGLISDIGILEKVDFPLIRVRCNYALETIAIGASIACDGCCLTVIALEQGEGGATIFDADVSNETLECTTLSTWQAGHKINLERSLTLGAELGGHIVTGHVDGVAQIINITDDDSSKRFTFSCPDALAPFIAAKGSVALNGTSFTVNTVNNNRFEINIIPHTQEVTTWGGQTIGNAVNIEIDMLARYVARAREYEA